MVDYFSRNTMVPLRLISCQDLWSVDCFPQIVRCSNPANNVEVQLSGTDDVIAALNVICPHGISISDIVSIHQHNCALTSTAMEFLVCTLGLMTTQAVFIGPWAGRSLPENMKWLEVHLSRDKEDPCYRRFVIRIVLRLVYSL